jgi:hypothetical protein
MRRILRLLWEMIWPFEICWGTEPKAVRRQGPAQLLEFPKQGSKSLTTSRTYLRSDKQDVASRREARSEQNGEIPVRDFLNLAQLPEDRKMENRN